MPMKTTFVTCSSRGARSRWKCSTCATTSSAGMFRSKPIWPVAQKTQPMAQPACVETQTVERGRRPGRGVLHEDGLDRGATGQGEERLGGLAVSTDDFGQDGGNLEGEARLRHTLAERAGELRDGVE